MNQKIITIIKKKDYIYIPYYICGNLIVKFEYFSYSIKIKSVKSYIFSFFNEKIICIFFIVFCSRAQKLKFKEVYKKDFENYFWLLILNFILSYFFLYYSVFFLFYKIQK